MENITLQQLLEMDEIQIKSILGELFTEKYKDTKASKVVVTVNLDKDKYDIVIKY